MTPSVDIEIPSRPGYVGVVRLALASLARTAGFDEEKVDDLKIVVSEACTNAVMAAEEAGSAAPIRIRWITGAKDGVTLEVEDPVPAAPAPGGIEDGTRQAMSVALLRSLVTSYETRPGPDGSTITSLRF